MKELRYFFEELFATSNPTDLAMHLDGQNRKVSNTFNRILIGLVADREIKQAIFSINPFGALVDDGFTVKFYQYFWEIITNDVCKAVKSFFIGGRMLRSFNYT